MTSDMQTQLLLDKFMPAFRFWRDKKCRLTTHTQAPSIILLSTTPGQFPLLSLHKVGRNKLATQYFVDHPDSSLMVHIGYSTTCCACLFKVLAFIWPLGAKVCSMRFLMRIRPKLKGGAKDGKDS